LKNENLPFHTLNPCFTSDAPLATALAPLSQFDSLHWVLTEDPGQAPEGHYW